MPIRVAIVEDHHLMLKAVAQELGSQNDIQVVGTVTHGAELQRLVRNTSPDVVILDLGMSTGTFEPVAAITDVRQAHPNVQFLVLTNYDDAAWVREVITAGALGYVLKDDDLSLCLAEGVRAVYSGKRFYSSAVTDKFFAHTEATTLTSKELAILRLLAQGRSNSCIAREMKLSVKTVCNYLWSIYDKLGVGDDTDVNQRVTAINRAGELGLLPDEA